MTCTPVVHLDSIWNDPDECAVRWAPEGGPGGSHGCYAHLATDPNCRFEDDNRLAAFLARTETKPCPKP